jgi:hypothetical protein
MSPHAHIFPFPLICGASRAEPVTVKGNAKSRRVHVLMEAGILCVRAPLTVNGTATRFVAKGKGCKSTQYDEVLGSDRVRLARWWKLR